MINDHSVTLFTLRDAGIGSVGSERRMGEGEPWHRRDNPCMDGAARDQVRKAVCDENAMRRLMGVRIKRRERQHTHVRSSAAVAVHDHLPPLRSSSNAEALSLSSNGEELATAGDSKANA